jgi:hypothetical protein
VSQSQKYTGKFSYDTLKDFNIWLFSDPQGALSL